MAEAAKEIQQYATPPENSPEGFKYPIEKFTGGDWDGFKFVAIQFPSAKAALDHFGDEHALEIINSAVSGRIRASTKNALVTGGTDKDKAKYRADKLGEHPDGVLFNVNDAFAWKPESRGRGETVKSVQAAMFAAMKEYGSIDTLPEYANLSSEEKATLKENKRQEVLALQARQFELAQNEFNISLKAA